MLHAHTPAARPASAPHAWTAQWPTFARIRASALTPTQRLVLRTLLDFPAPRCPSVATLAEGTGYHPRTVERALSDLVALGWLRRGGASIWGTVVYHVEGDVPRLTALDATHGSISIRHPPVQDSTPQNAAVYGVVNEDRASESCSDPLPGRGVDPSPGEKSTSTETSTETSTPAGIDRDPPAVDPATPGRMPDDPIQRTEKRGAGRPHPFLPSSLTPEGRAVLEVLQSHPALAPVAFPGLAARWGAMVTPSRPLGLVLRGLAELGDAAGDAAAAGHPWTPGSLAGRARAWIRGAREDRKPERGGARYAPPDRDPAPPPVDCLSLAEGWRAVSDAMSRPTPGGRRPT